jgi:hypothetical protein
MFPLSLSLSPNEEKKLEGEKERSVFKQKNK